MTRNNLGVGILRGVTLVASSTQVRLLQQPGRDPVRLGARTRDTTGGIGPKAALKGDPLHAS